MSCGSDSLCFDVRFYVDSSIFRFLCGLRVLILRVNDGCSLCFFFSLYVCVVVSLLLNWRWFGL